MAQAAAQPVVRSPRALVVPKVVAVQPAAASLAAAVLLAAVVLPAVVVPRAAELLAVAVPRVAAARPRVVCLTLEAAPLAVVRVDIPLQAVARAVAAAAE